MTQSQQVRAQLLFERRTEDASLDACGARRPVDFENAVYPGEVNRDGTAVIPLIWRLNPADYARTAAVWGGRDSSAITPFEDSHQVLLVARISDQIKRIRIMTAISTHQVPETPAIRVACAIVGTGVKEGRERIGRLHTWGTQV